MKPILFALVLAVIPSAIGCRALKTIGAPSAATPSPQPAAAAGQRCAVGIVTESPFLVDWSAKDLAAFESLAEKDLVFVRYADCGLTLLEGCVGADLPGKYGRYQEPTFAGGSKQSFAVRSGDELYSRLPLGRAVAGPSVDQGNLVELRYFVSGAVAATREKAQRQMIANNPGCASATHFVRSYNLGAYEVTSRAPVAGPAAGPQTSQPSAAAALLSSRGGLKSCETSSLEECQRPIRIVLQRIDEQSGAQVAEASAGAGVVPAMPSADGSESPLEQARQLRESATNKETKGEGAGCLVDLERADTLDGTPSGRQQAQYTRALCQMQAGLCDKGKATLKDYLRAADAQRMRTDADLSREIEALSQTKCPLSAQTTIEGKVVRLQMGVAQAQTKRDTAGCKAMATEAEKIFLAVDKSNLQQRGSVAGIVQQASQCLIQLGRCKEAQGLWIKYYELAFAGQMTAEQLRLSAEHQFALVPACQGK